ncbi:MAG TPA: EfeM/EfeO family lipoprotein [Jatrophihabitans sp.]|nr:EfeM/EfeO family lipoprotein [Jatrophihabitans sp.]
MRLSTAPAQTTTTGRATTPLGGVVDQYRSYVADKLDQLASNVVKLRIGLLGSDRTEAQRRWLAAQLTWQQIGAAYGSFGTYGNAISGLANGLPAGVADPAFTGLHRVEYGLYHGASSRELRASVDRLAVDINGLRRNLDTVPIVPTDMPIRCHEILEDSLRDHLTGQSDYGSGMAYALTSADVLATRELMSLLKPLLPPAPPGHSLDDLSAAALNVLDAALAATQVHGAWPSYPSLTKQQRQPVNGAIGGALEVLSRYPSTLGRLK